MALRSDASAIDRLLHDAVAAGRVPGAVAAVTDRQGTVCVSAAGMAASVSPSPMHVDAVFRVASMTKLVTTIAVMMLLEERRLELDDPLAQHVPGFEQPPVLASFDAASGEYSVRDAARPITIRDLLTHTSGFGYWFLNPELRRVGAVDYLNAPFLMHDPGAKFSYGISTDVLGRIIEPLSGLELDEFVERRITEPLGMHSTGFAVPRDGARLAALHQRRGTGFVDAPNEREAEAPRGGGGLYTTAEDYLAVLRMLLNGGALAAGGVSRLLAEETVAEITTNRIGELYAGVQTTAAPERTNDFAFMDGTQKFGFGVMIDTLPREAGRPAGSYGWGGIFNTYFWADPFAGIAAVLMMQLTPFCDSGCLELYRELERAVYDRIA